MQRFTTRFIIALMATVLPVQALANSGSALEWFRSRQDSTGAIDGATQPTDWVTIAVSATGTNPASIGSPSLVDALKTTSVGSATTSIERRILALRAAGLSASAEAAQLLGYVTNEQIGDPVLLNDDMFGILALRAANTGSNAIAQAALLLEQHQHSDGGFSSFVGGSSDVDSTGAALTALIVGGGSAESINRGFAYLAAQQNSNGGFGVNSGVGSNVDSTSWALWAYHTAGRSNAAAEQWLRSAQQASGSFGGAVSTAYAVIALSDRAWPIVGSFPVPTPVPSPSPAPSPIPAPLPAPAPSLAPLPVPVSPLSPNRSTSVSTSVSVSIGAMASASGSSTGGVATRSSTLASTGSGILSGNQVSGNTAATPTTKPAVITTVIRDRAGQLDQSTPSNPVEPAEMESPVASQSQGDVHQSADQPSADAQLVQRLIVALVLVGTLDLLAIGLGVGRWAARARSIGRFG